MDFIFMLTRRDQTIDDAQEVFDTVAPLGIRHIGFKDVGASRDALRSLTDAIKSAGAISYMEVVSTTSDTVRRSIETAAEIGVDRILGGKDLDTAREMLGSDLSRLYPFPGTPHGHPTALAGTSEAVARDCRAYVAAGCGGVDLLAFRASDAEPLDLVRAARRALEDRELIVAGSIDSPERIHELARAGADAFTIGSAIFDGSFSPDKGGLRSRLRDVLHACESAPRAA